MYWLRDKDMLPAAVPEARIYTYDWDSDFIHDAPVQHMLGLADNLLGLLSGRPEAESRPIIFVASCFGGLIVAEVRTGRSSDAAQLETNTLDRRSTALDKKVVGFDTFSQRSAAQCFWGLLSRGQTLQAPFDGRRSLRV